MFGLFKRETPPPSQPVVPQAFCTGCGKPMVNSYLVFGERFDPDTGRKQEKRVDGRVCSRMAGRTYEYEDGHDGTWSLFNRSFGFDRAYYWTDK